MNAAPTTCSGRTPTGVLLGVASTGVAELLDGPPRPATVLASFPRALYLGHAGGVVAIETSDGVHLPNGLVLTRTSAVDPLAGMRPGTLGAIGRARVEVGQLTVTVVRWRRARPVLAPVAVGALRCAVDEATATLACAGALPPALERPLRAIVVAMRASRGDVAASVATSQLLGLGPGLTPSGDDILAGLVAAAQLLDAAVLGADEGGHVAAAARELGREVADVAPRATTAISASLLHHAARGEVAAPAAQLLAALSGTGEVPAAVARLLDVGATSGRDLAVGLLAGATLVVTASASPRGRTSR